MSYKLLNSLIKLILFLSSIFARRCLLKVHAFSHIHKNSRSSLTLGVHIIMSHAYALCE